MAKWKNAGKGVRFREHETERFNGSPDKYFAVRFKRVNRQFVEVGVGWSSDGWNLTKARDKRTELIEADRKGEPITGKEIKVAEEAEKERSITIGRFFAERYLPWAKEHKKSWVDDLRYFKRHLEPRFGEKTFDAVSAFDIEKMKMEMKKGVNKRGVPFAAATIKHQLVILRRLYNLARKWGNYEGKSPLEAVDMPKLDNQRTEYFTDEETRRLLDTLKNWPCKETVAFIKFAMFTGMRRGEIFKLKWEDIDFDRGLITLREPKGGKTETLPVSNETLQILRELEERSTYVFPGKDGGQRHNFYRPWKRIRQAAGLPENFRFHGLRHNFASTLVSAGYDLLVVGKLLTHKDAKTTQRYAHLSPGALKEAALNSGELLTPKAKEEAMVENGERV